MDKQKPDLHGKQEPVRKPLKNTPTRSNAYKGCVRLPYRHGAGSVLFPPSELQESMILRAKYPQALRENPQELSIFSP